MSWKRTVVGSLAVAVAFVTVWWFSGGGLKPFLDRVFGDVFVPAVMAAIALSSHPDNLNPWIYFLALVVQAFAMAFPLVAAADALRSALRAK